MSTIASLGNCDVGNNNIMGGLWDGLPAHKTKFPYQGHIIFSHSMPFITAHGFTGLKFIQNRLLNNPENVSEA